MKDILVVSTGGAYDEKRFACAENFARHFGGFVRVVVTNEISPAQIVVTDPAIQMVPIDDELRKESLAKGEELRDKALERFAALPQPVSVVLINEVMAYLGESVVEFARLSDIFITTIPTDSTKAELMKAVIDQALVNGGCGILCLPHGATSQPVFDHIVIAWDGRRAASRAVVRAMPLLEIAKKVSVLLVDPPLRRAGEQYHPGDGLLAKLAHNGISAELMRVTSDHLGTAKAITTEVGRVGADLLVMGAQAEGGLRQWLQGSVSRKVLADAKLPLFIAH